VTRAMTRAQRAVLSALADRGKFVSAQDIHGRLRAKGDATGLTSVYRALQALAEAGEVDVLRSASGEAVYRRCETTSHHHHLVCRACGHAVEVAGPGVERWAVRTAQAHGFQDVGHTVEVYGTCPDCAR
jgi:Fur family transcriptional regulator, ferric uptake regulator